jgi:serine/threonine protein kinase
MEPQNEKTDELIGQTVGNYQVTQKLGEGGMGSVYLAEHPQIGKKVALKVLHAEFSSNQDVVSRFFNEARAVNDIGHPNIVDIVDYGVIETTGQPMVYFIMEFLGGRSLAHLIRSEAPLPPERAFTIASQVADALAASHRKNIVHRDLKPDNIMLVQRGRDADFVKLLDFGIAKLTGDQHGSSRTRTGIVMGTPAYMSPEQCEGRGSVDLRTDIYALGIVLYEMLTGRVPFVGEGYGEILVQHLTQPPAPPSTFRGLAPQIELVVLKALEKRPDLRYPNMEEFARALGDPAGYIAACGGPSVFLATPITPSVGPVPVASRFTPPPQTPAPGSLHAVATTPTTMGASAGEVQPRGGRTLGLFAAAGLLAVGAGTGIYLATRGGDDKPTAGLAAPGDGSGSGSSTRVAAGPADAAPAIEAGGTGSGSAIAGTGSGSAIAGTGDGSGSGAVATVAKTITLTITTTPGATISIDGKKRAVATEDTTTLELDRADRVVDVKVELGGHETLRGKISLATDDSPSWLLKKKGSGGKTGGGQTGKTGSGKTGGGKTGGGKTGGGETGGGDGLLDPNNM